MEGGVWGIVIIISAFMIQFFVFGISGSIGVYNIEFLDYYGASAAQISIIGALNYGFFLGSGPIVSFLMTKFTFRKVALFGSVLVVLAVLLVPVFPYLGVLYLSLGILTGFGSCCVYIPSHTLSGLYYDKYQSLATGVATSGSGLGGAVMPVLIGMFIDIYSWKGSIVLLAGLCFHLFIFSGLLRDPKLNTKEQSSTNNDERHNAIGANDCYEKEIEAPPVQVSNMVSKFDDDGQVNIGSGSLESHPLKCSDRLSWRPGAYLSTESLIISNLETFPATKTCLKGCDEEVGSNGVKMADVPESRTEVDSERNMEREEFLKQSDHRSIPSKVDNHEESPESMRHIYIFKNYNFDVYFLNSIFWNLSCTIMLTFTPEYLTVNGLTSMEAAWLQGAGGFGCFVGGIAGGVIGNIKGIDRVYLFTAICFSMGTVLLIIPFGSGLVFYAIILSIWGIHFGIILGLLIIVLIDLIGIKSLSNGMGYVMLANGIGCFLGPLFAGMIIDEMGFDWSIYFAGLNSLLAGLSMLLIPLRRYLVRNK